MEICQEWSKEASLLETTSMCYERYLGPLSHAEIIIIIIRMKIKIKIMIIIPVLDKITNTNIEWEILCIEKVNDRIVSFKI